MDPRTPSYEEFYEKEQMTVIDGKMILLLSSFWRSIEKLETRGVFRVNLLLSLALFNRRSYWNCLFVDLDDVPSALSMP